jgi:hypothetical protein
MTIESDRNELLYAVFTGTVSEPPAPSLAALPTRIKELKKNE